MSRKKERAKLENTTGKRINAADITIILLVILFIVGMVLRFGVMDKIENRATEKTATVSFLIEGVSAGNAGYITAGDKMYISDSGMEMGVVASVAEPEPSTVYYHTDDGKIISYPSVDGKINIRGTMTVKGSLDEQGFFLGGTNYVAPNMSLYVHSEKISVNMLITNIEVTEN